MKRPKINKKFPIMWSQISKLISAFSFYGLFATCIIFHRFFWVGWGAYYITDASAQWRVQKLYFHRKSRFHSNRWRKTLKRLGRLWGFQREIFDIFTLFKFKIKIITKKKKKRPNWHFTMGPSQSRKDHFYFVLRMSIRTNGRFKRYSEYVSKTIFLNTRKIIQIVWEYLSIFFFYLICNF